MLKWENEHLGRDLAEKASMKRLRPPFNLALSLLFGGATLLHFKIKSLKSQLRGPSRFNAREYFRCSSISIILFGLLGAVLLSSCQTVDAKKYEDRIAALERLKQTNEEKLQGLNDQLVSLQDDKAKLEERITALSDLAAGMESLKSANSALQDENASLKAKTFMLGYQVATLQTRLRVAEKKAAEGRLAKEQAQVDQQQNAGYLRLGVKPTSIQCFWAMIPDFGSYLFEPQLNITLQNVSSKQIEEMQIRVEFVDIAEKTIFSETQESLASKYLGNFLPPGFSKELVMTAGKGFRDARPPNLPNLTAEIYVGNTLLSKVEVEDQ